MSLKGVFWTIIRRMIVTMRTGRLRTVERVRAFLNGSAEVDFKPDDRALMCDFVRRALVRPGYQALGRVGKGVARRCLGKVTGLSRAQVSRLTAQHRKTGRIEDRRGANSGRSFERIHTSADIRLLVGADETGEGLCGPAA